MKLAILNLSIRARLLLLVLVCLLPFGAVFIHATVGVHQIGKSSLLLGAALVTLALGFAWWLGASIIRPVHALTRAAERVATGDASARARPSGPPEIKSVARQFNRMLDANVSAQQEHHQALLDLQESQHRYQSLIDSSPIGIGVHRGGKIVYVNPAAVELLGATFASELLGRQILDLVHPDYRAVVLERVQRGMALGVSSPLLEEKFIRMDGAVIDVEVQSTPIMYEGAHAVRVGFRDVSARKAAERETQLAASVFTHAREAIMITDPDGTIVKVNQAFTRITGYEAGEVLGKNPRILKSGRHPVGFYSEMRKCLAERGHWSGEFWNRRKDGALFAGLQTISAVRAPQGGVLHYVSLLTDMTALKANEQKLEHLVHFDLLTNLPNRVLLADRMRQAMAQSQRRGQSLAVACLDIDGFKDVNDRYGQTVGDQLLMALSQRMKTALRAGDTLARIGGDEFVAVLVDLDDPQDCEPFLDRLLHAASDTIKIDDVVLQVSASIGVTLYPKDGVDADLLLRHADQAMYQAKQAGKNRYHLFDVVHADAIVIQRRNLDAMQKALDQEEFVLYYQPKVNMRSGKVTGAEALIRWQHPQRGLLPPGAFLPYLEDDPLSVAVGEWVITTALAQMEVWRASGFIIPVSVNIGALQLQQDEFVQRLRDLLAAYPQIPSYTLELEVLESSAMEDMTKVFQTMHACRDMGVLFALDDFGTGYSSLTYLRSLPADTLKIDQSFVRDMLTDFDDLAIVQGVIGLAAAFHRTVIAEGVETALHGQKLLSIGCELAQGYGVSRPMPASDLPDWARAWEQEPRWTA
ncbi:MAG: EAL domain-containing protein [Rhodoferax sp.]|nr:EAL domain-containing protein [Rhodoferax sp.]